MTSGIDAAYELFKAANALFFALTAIPVYLLARRLVPPWWAVCAAGLSVAIPSSISVSTVMTESLAFLTAAWALYAIALALERPTLYRQLAVLAAIATAFLTRAAARCAVPLVARGLVVLWLIAAAAQSADTRRARPAVAERAPARARGRRAGGTAR